VKVLLDTCVVAELRRPEGHPSVQAAVSELADGDLFLSLLTVGEIAKGISLLPTGKKRRSLASWLNGLETRFADRILGVDLETARLWGELTARAPQRVHHTSR
jgi:toxin FitB